MNDRLRCLAIFGFLAMAGCSSNDAEVIRDVCIPVNEEGGPRLEDLAKVKGYDIEDTKSVCRKWFKAEMKKLSEDMRASGL